MNKEAKKVLTAITPTREEDYSEWYLQVIKAAELAENSAVRGCMVIRPWGWAIWENIQRALDARLKETGHENAYFPLFVPLSFLQKEAAHVEGFAKECAVVTHHRLHLDREGDLVPDPESKLEEPLVVRPTSETIIGESFAKWVESYRDLPLLINQWANVVRWEMRTRLFLRSCEFLWQEGHTAHATKEEALAESQMIHELYAQFGREVLAIPFIKGQKTESEKFPGADITYTIEAMMQDRKALQAGTSHFLGQNFAKASNIRFSDENGAIQHAWTTSWGVTTRLIGALVMTHSDDDGMVLPPRIAPKNVVIIPVIPKPEMREKVLAACEELKRKIAVASFGGEPVRVFVDSKESGGGGKTWYWIKKGVPVRIEVGPRDIDSGSFPVSRRDRPHKDKTMVNRSDITDHIVATLEDIQESLYQKACALREAHTVKINTKEEFYAFFTPKNKDKPEVHGGFALCHWNGSSEVEEIVKKDLGVTIRCIPIDAPKETGTCVITGEPSERRVIFAKSY